MAQFEAGLLFTSRVDAATTALVMSELPQFPNPWGYHQVVLSSGVSLMSLMCSGHFELSFFVGFNPDASRAAQWFKPSVGAKTQRRGRSKACHMCFPLLSISLSLSHLSWFAVQKCSAAVKWNVSRANPCNIIPSESSVETTLVVNRGWPVSRYNSHIVFIRKKKKLVRWQRLLLHVLLRHLLILHEEGRVCVGAHRDGELPLRGIRVMFSCLWNTNRDWRFFLFMETWRPNQGPDRSESELSPRVREGGKRQNVLAR